MTCNPLCNLNPRQLIDLQLKADTKSNSSGLFTVFLDFPTLCDILDRETGGSVAQVRRMQL